MTRRQSRSPDASPARPILAGILSTAAAVALLAGVSNASWAAPGVEGPPLAAGSARETRAFTRYERDLAPGRLTLEAAAVHVPVPGGDLRAALPASLALRARLPFRSGLALRVRPGAGHVAPLVSLELARAPAAITSAR